MLNEVLEIEEYESLKKIAYQKSKPFCYGCYREVTKSHCSKCGSDDIMLSYT